MANKIEPYKGIAEIYEEIRPLYPEALINDVINRTELKIDDYLLEIGAGTGKAMIQFAKKGFKIRAIEIGQDMADILIDKCAEYPNVTIDVLSFEEWINDTNHKFDIIYCAQAFHWIDKNIKYKKCHDLLKDNGYLILFWYSSSNDKADSTREIQGKIDLIVKKYVSDFYNDMGKPERLEHDGVYKEDERKAEIISSGLFEMLEKIEYTHEIKNNAEQYLKAMKSVPSYATLLDGLDHNVIESMDNEIKEMINNHGGFIGAVFNFSLYIAKKI